MITGAQVIKLKRGDHIWHLGLSCMKKRPVKLTVQEEARYHEGRGTVGLYVQHIHSQFFLSKKELQEETFLSEKEAVAELIAKRMLK